MSDAIWRMEKTHSSAAFIFYSPGGASYHGMCSVSFLPHCMQCRRGLAMRKVSVVHPHVRLSVKRVNCDKTEEISAQICIPYERSFSLVFGRRMVGGGYPFYLKFWVNRPPLDRNRRFSTDIPS